MNTHDASCGCRQKREAAAAHQRCQEEKQALQTQLTSACGVRDKLKQQLEATGEKVGETAAVLEQAEQANLDLQQKLAAATASRDALLQQTEKQRLQVGAVGVATSCTLQLLPPDTDAALAGGAPSPILCHVVSCLAVSGSRDALAGRQRLQVRRLSASRR